MKHLHPPNGVGGGVGTFSLRNAPMGASEGNEVSQIEGAEEGGNIPALMSLDENGVEEVENVPMMMSARATPQSYTVSFAGNETKTIGN